ncbi:sensor histidine kinase, partial [Ruminococcus sp. 210702-SL.1.03]|nr:sensor histidine kinase [Ruminococcus sp. 210702-SL.1.03]
IDVKAQQIKDMADCILEYSLQKKKTELVTLEQKSFRSAFFDILSETCICLEQSGFTVRASLLWEDREISVDPKYVTRILDNI